MEMKEINTIVIVTRIESYTEPGTGKRGKKIEFVNIRQPNVKPVSEETPEIRMVRDMLMQLKTMGFPFIQNSIKIPKIILYLSREEEDALNIDFKVNHVYKLVFENASIRFVDVTNEYYFVT
jgi:hypothetical protein